MTDPESQLRGENIDLWQVHPDDYRYMYWLSLSEFNNVRWRYRGQLPPFETFVAQIHSDVLAQFIVRSRTTGDPVGYCVAYGADLRNRHCYIGVLTDPTQIGIGTGSEALAMLTDYLFRTWDLHKVFAEVPAFTLEPMSGKLDRLTTTANQFAIEGTLSEYVYYDGRMWDMYIVSATASEWRTRQAKTGSESDSQL